MIIMIMTTIIVIIVGPVPVDHRVVLRDDEAAHPRGLRKPGEGVSDNTATNNSHLIMIMI